MASKLEVEAVTLFEVPRTNTVDLETLKNAFYYNFCMLELMSANNASVKNKPKP